MPERRRHWFHPKGLIKTKWSLCGALLILLVLAVSLTRGFWTAEIGRSLVCSEDLAPSDMILVENFNPNYLVFERAAALQKEGLASRALVPVQAFPGPEAANPVSTGIAELMARHARMASWAMVPIRETEPISLNAAAQIRQHLAREHVRSLIVVTPGLRSRRSVLIHHAMLDELGIRVQCAPVFGRATPERWTDTWHGIQQVTQEFIKLQYYRLYVLPFVAPRARRDAGDPHGDSPNPLPVS